MRRWMFVWLVVAGWPAVASSADLDARAHILSIELKRGPTTDLQRYLGDAPDPALWAQAVRAAGRIGDVSSDVLPKLLARYAPGDDGALPPCPDVRGLLWASGLPWVSNTTADEGTRTAWGDAVRPFLKGNDEPTVAAAAHALGWIAPRGVGDDLLPLLHHASASVRAEALNGLGRAGREGHLERCLRFVEDDDEIVRAAAQFACWRLAGRRRAAAQKAGEWQGDAQVARAALRLLASDNAEERMGALRIAGLVLDEELNFDGVREALSACARDTDPRVAQDYVWRILQTRKGEWVEEQLVAMALRADPKIRSLAYDALAERESDYTRDALQARAKAEQDERLLDQLAVALMKRGDGRLVDRLLTETKTSDPVTRSIRRAEAFVAMKSARAAAVIRNWLSLEHAEGGVVHTAVWMTALDGLQDRDDPDVKEWIRSLATSKKLRQKRPYLAAAALGAMKEAKPEGAWTQLKQVATDLATEKPIADIDNALMEALVANQPEGEAGREELVQMLLVRLASAASEFSRQAAANHLKKLVPELDPPAAKPTNDWKGLPTPSHTWPDLVISGSELFTWLNEKQILQVADWIQRRRPVCVFETTAGQIRVTLHPETAPVHSVNLLLACHTGVYVNTRFHRVVPNFVIQGGDPHGHGAGGGGWTVPDEITPWPYDRGALGMPKSVKDDGGCQIFIMHTGYRPLDERYTNYATVVAGMDVVDRIRVGDRITECHVEVP